MEFSFKRLPERFQKPLSILGERYHFIESASGREIEFISGDENHLKICADEHKIVITSFIEVFVRLFNMHKKERQNLNWKKKFGFRLMVLW